MDEKQDEKQDQGYCLTFKDKAHALRLRLRVLAEDVKTLHKAPFFLIAEEHEEQHAEMHANLALSYRHIEDATMRLGKAIQAYDGGTSVYPQ